MIGGSETFRIDVVPSSGDVTVVVCGDIDVATARELNDNLQAVERSSRDVIVDLTGVGFIDAAALRVLILSHRRLAATGRHLTLYNVSGPPSRVLLLAGLADTFNLTV